MASTMLLNTQAQAGSKMTRSQKRKLKAHRKLVRDFQQGGVPVSRASSLGQGFLGDSVIADAVLRDAYGQEELSRLISQRERNMPRERTLMSPLLSPRQSISADDTEWVQVTGLEDWEHVDQEDDVDSHVELSQHASTWIETRTLGRLESWAIGALLL
eukprot:CAMPEP_0202859544 /NCGR_PEP_ID=MMETSP1391-20130828/1604_1 /ASSEMBLY_ACC=CAM_ASM_000867 /TAXON_ID=1034604 /ORGANISM="Chlamydomonas leiostraca, Strain SAG 11-49" /LENGTH=157 /DNA_ID=CAMNT_0049538585 /DNA_START=84 /DNA_END=558 /DNA_ORIENTATION=-